MFLGFNINLNFISNIILMTKKTKKIADNWKGAGRKPADDPKDKFTLFIERSFICGEENKRLDVNSDEYKKMYADFKQFLYDKAYGK